MDVSRRQFFKICAGGMAGTTVAALGFAPKQALAQARNYKLLRAKEIRNTCTYCSVGCGLLMYSLGDGAKNAREAIYHIEGDPDHPVSRGALCPKGAGLLDYVNSENRLRYPEYRAPGSDKWQRISWEEAYDIIATNMQRLIKEYGNESIYLNYGTGTLGGTMTRSWPPGNTLVARLMNCCGGYLNHYGDYSSAQ
ncbi:molybdopterin-dependent oxidoreductase, partial [Acinetobacter baumannii]